MALIDRSVFGVYAILCNGYYHISRVYRNGFPEGLGVAAIGGIPAEKGAFDAYIARLRRTCENLESEELRQFIEDINDGVTGTTWLPVSESSEYGLFLSRTPPLIGRSATWVYTIDLDRMIYTLDNAIHFDLFRMPRSGEWTRHLAFDGRGHRCLEPGTSANLGLNHNDLSSSEKESIILRSNALYSRDGGRVIVQDMEVEKFNDMASMDAFQECTVQMAKGFMTAYLQLSDDARFYHPSTADFQTKAAFLLSLIAPGFYSTANRSGDCSVDRDHVFASSTSPRGTYFWFRRCLVVMASHLDYENHLQAHISDIVKYVRVSGMEECTAIMWSISHVAVIRLDRCEAGDIVKHTPVLPALAALRVDDNALTTTLRILAYHLAPPVFHRDAPLRQSGPSLPLDIIFEIMGYLDEGAYHAMGLVCKALRFQCVAHPIVGPYRLLGLDLNRLRANMMNGRAIDMSFFYRLQSDEYESTWDDINTPAWTPVTSDFPVLPSSFFSFERFKGDEMDFYVGPLVASHDALLIQVGNLSI
ncbi:hypothetical protein SCHPADRAFT_946329 [Schizopora paradoxa]|uniref:F-box domain-containing protein n=1 Tax=Schizopora paradoxa TaxID=27342 RepID=A0A0H2R9K6_9AGAM|nr:hypothetical protein SCHPADRAFT_946329 [Schizopora paradoxa]